MGKASRVVQILDMARRGKTALEISNELNCNSSYVYRICKTNNVPITKATPGPRKAGFSPTWGRLAEQIGRDLFVYRDRVEGLTFAEMAERLNMTKARLIKAESAEVRLTLPELTNIANTLCGMFASDVIKGRITLLEAIKGVETWPETFSEQVVGDNLDPKEGVKKLIRFITKNVREDGLVLRTGWDKGLSEEEKVALGLEFDADEQERTYSEILDLFSVELDTSVTREGEKGIDDFESAGVRHDPNDTTLYVPPPPAPTPSPAKKDPLWKRFLRHMDIIQ